MFPTRGLFRVRTSRRGSVGSGAQISASFRIFALRMVLLQKRLVAQTSVDHHNTCSNRNN